MKKESMIRVLRYKAENIKTHITPKFFQEVANTLEAEEKPCSDAISRANAIKRVSECLKGVFVEYEDIARKMFAEDKVPSVQPKIKVGHWIKITPSGIYKCSECEQNVLTGDIDAYHYCHHCGIKMINEGENHENQNEC